MKSLVVLILTVLALACIFGTYHDRKIEAHFIAVNPSMTEADVRNLLADPAATQPNCQAYGTDVTGNCDHVFVYKSFFSAVHPRYWLVFFGKDGLVTAKSRQVTP